MDMFFVGLGGALGSLARYQLGKTMAQKQKSQFPWGTFAINVSGALLLGLIISLDLNRNIALLIGDGFLGAYTTFSTFMYEGFNLFQKKEKLNAMTYISLSFVLGLIGYVSGLAIGKLF